MLGQEQGAGPRGCLSRDPPQTARFAEQPWGSHLFQRSVQVCVCVDNVSWVFAACILCFCKAFLGVLFTFTVGRELWVSEAVVLYNELSLHKSVACLAFCCPGSHNRGNSPGGKFCLT